jgi:hypothetical protein
MTGSFTTLDLIAAAHRWSNPARLAALSAACCQKLTPILS